MKDYYHALRRNKGHQCNTDKFSLIHPTQYQIKKEMYIVDILFHSEL